ncbi:hypothetical protein ABZ366_02775 [Streptomyces sp. NPDC005904]
MADSALDILDDTRVGAPNKDAPATARPAKPRTTVTPARSP